MNNTLALPCPAPKSSRRSAIARFAGVATAAVAAVAVLSTGGAASASNATPGGAPKVPGTVALTWAAEYMSNDHDYTLAEAVSLAKRHDLIAAMPVAFEDYTSQMRAANPDLVLLSYANATLAPISDTTGLPASAFAHDVHGDKIKAPGFDTYLMESSSPQWRQRANDICNARVAQSGYDGCLMDMLTLGIFSPGYVTALPVNPATGAVYTEEQYQNQMTQLSSYFHRASPRMVHIGNAVENSYRYWQAPVPSRTAVATMPAAQMEDFLRGSGDSVHTFPSTADWVRNVKVITDMEHDDTVGLFTTKLWVGADRAQVAQWQQYAMATFLMGADGHSYFAFTASRDKAGVMETNAPFTMPTSIGRPRGAMKALRSGLYVRRFTGGLSVVNPTGTTLRLKLAGPMVRLNGHTTHRMVVLTPHHGVVLTRVHHRA